MARRRLLFSLLFCLMSVATPPRAVAEAPINGLVAYWPFAGDASVWGPYRKYDGVVSGPILITDRHGVPNHAYQFAGGNNHISVPASPALKPPLPLTVSAWIRLDASTAGWEIFTNSFGTNTYSGVWIDVLSAAQSPPVSFAASYGSGGGPFPFSRRSKFASTTLSIGVWYHVAAVIRGPLDMSLYVNGVDDGGTYNGSGGSLSYDGSASIEFGRETTGTFKGAIDDVYLYNRALSASEVMDLYLTGTVLDAGSGPPLARGLRVSPNPARSAQSVLIDVGNPNEASVTIRDVGGRIVREFRPASGAGHTQIQWDGCDVRGVLAPPGIYLVSNGAAGPNAVAKLVILR